jgi:dimethylaniline monooxygenase (N-oxide forming)
VTDFYLGCQHVSFNDLFLVGFARPIIGNIPTISEMQARYVIGLIAGDSRRLADIADRHEEERNDLAARYPKLNSTALYPVEMISYCDRLALLMESYPSLRKVGSFRRWLKIKLTPASTLHYVNEDYDPAFIDRQTVHSPAVITFLLCLIKLFDIPYSVLKGKRKG